MKYKAIRIIITLCLLLLFPVLLQAADIHGEEDSEPNRPVFSTSANEQIDPFSGRLILAYTDMRFPGNGGLDLEIIRTDVADKDNAYIHIKAAMDELYIPEVTFEEDNYTMEYAPRFKKINGFYKLEPHEKIDEYYNKLHN